MSERCEPFHGDQNLFATEDRGTQIRETRLGRILHRGGGRGNGAVSEVSVGERGGGCWGPGSVARSQPDEDLEEPKLVGFVGMSGDLGAGRVGKRERRQMSEPSKEELLARIAELEKQAGSKRKGTLEFRVGEKGGVSVYGLGRFPVTLYYEQWIRLLDVAEGLRAFLEENKSKLKLKTAE